ncbi:hypothetical protein [Polaromonas sp. CG9_12]|nr:hypothetical protein [Polaromonas sp. CG9_12]
MVRKALCVIREDLGSHDIYSQTGRARFAVGGLQLSKKEFANLF